MKHITIFTFLAFSLLGAAQSEKRSINENDLWALGRVSGGQLSPDKTKMLYGVSNYSIEKNTGGRTLFIYDFKNKTSIEIAKRAYSEVWHPDGNKVGFILPVNNKMAIHEYSLETKEVTPIENTPGLGVSNFSYSPTAEHISFTQSKNLGDPVKDQHPDLPLADAKIIDDLMYRHWDRWDDHRVSHLYIMEYKKGKAKGEPIDVMEGEPFDTPLEPFGGSEHIAWNPNGKSIAYVSKKLLGKEYATSTNSDIYLYDIESAKTKNVTKGLMGYDTDPVFSPDGSMILFNSMARDGFESDKNVLWLYDLSSTQRKALTKDIDMTFGHTLWSKDGTKLYTTAPLQATYQVFEFSLSSRFFPVIQPLTSGVVKAVTTGFANHSLKDILDDNTLIISRTTMNEPADIHKVEISTKHHTNITKANEVLLSTLKTSKIDARSVQATDGKEVFTWVIYPPDFDPKKKYPTLLYCQGGPQSAVSQFFSYRWNFRLMAAKGYIVVAPNRRGLPSFGQEWNDAISKDWGGQAMNDYLSAIDELAKESFVDKERLGAVGASYGGYSVYYLAGIHKKRFKSFISHCGLFNLESWYGSTEELFFANWDIGGPYWNEPTPESYNNFSPHKLVKNWDTPVLVIHGGKDFRVPENQGMEAFTAAQLKGLKSKFLYFPNEGHWILRPQNGLLWHREFFKWLDDTL